MENKKKFSSLGPDFKTEGEVALFTTIDCEQTGTVYKEGKQEKMSDGVKGLGKSGKKFSEKDRL